MTRKTLNKKSRIQKSKRKIKTLKKSKKKTRKTKKNYKRKNKNTRSKKKRGGDVNANLRDASIQGNLLIVQALLNDTLFDNVDINEYAVGTNGQIIGTPLYLASEKGHLDVVKELIAHRADINKGTDAGVTPLSAASLNGHVKVVNELLNNKASVDQADNKDGSTPLHLASWYDYVDIVRALVEEGADVNIKDRYGDTPLHIASSEGFLDVVKALFQGGANINLSNNDEDTPMSRAASRGHVEVVRYLMKMGADIDEADINDLKPLHLAAENDYVDVVRALVEEGADVNIKDRYGDTPLHIASSEGFLDVVKALFQGGANINQRNNEGDTPLSRAAHAGRVEVVKYLMEMGADINLADNDNARPIDIAAEENHINVVNLLIPKMTEEEFSQCEKNSEGKVECGILYSELNREDAVLPEVVQTEEDTRKRKKTSNLCFDRSAFQKFLRTAEENSDSEDDAPPPQPRHPYTKQPIDRNWINKWYPLGVGERTFYSVQTVPTGGKRKKKKNTTRKKKRGAGPACSRPQVIEDNQSDYSDGSNPDYPIIAEQMPDNEPLRPGEQRIPTVPYPSATAESVPEIPIASTEISLDTDNTPDLKAYNPALYNTKLSKTKAHNLYNIIYNTGRIEEDTKEIEDEVVEALMNYVYHVNYFDSFSAQAHGNPNKIGDYRELYAQLYNLISAWNKYDGKIEHLLSALRSDPDEEIGF